MSDCEISIELDRPDRRYRAGETVSGRVVVQTNEEVTCNGLTLSFFWRTHGSGDRNRGGEKTRSLFEGTWRTGETNEYPFEFEVPDHPLTYHGEYVNVDWYLKATADIPWAFDPEAETDLVVEEDPDRPPRKQTGSSVEPEVEDRSGRQGTNWLKVGCAGVVGLVFMMVGLAVLYGYVQNILDPNNWIFLIVGGGLSLFGARFVFMAIKNYLAAQSFNDLRVDLEPLVVTPGDTVQCLVRFTAGSKITLNGMNVTLKGFEHAVDDHGTDSTTYEETFSTTDRDIQEAEGTYRKGQTGKFTVELPVPEDAPPTFQAEDNKIRWHCRVYIDVNNWPDWSREFPLEVVR